MKLSEIKPFVRFSHYRGSKDEYRRFSYPLCAGDCRLLYCCEGNGKIIIGEAEYDVKYGTLLLWRAGIPYTYIPNEKAPMLLLGVNFDYTWEYSHITLPIPPAQSKNGGEVFSVEAPAFEDCDSLNGVVVIQNAGESFHKRLVEINREFEKKKNYFEIKCSGILTQLLCEVGFLAESGVDPDSREQLADEIIEYLSANYSDNISVDSLGAMFGYHPNYLNHLFIKYTGRPIYSYLQDLRIMQAIRLLENSNMTVSEIGNACGFADRAHFSRYFKQKTGRPPKAFRP